MIALYILIPILSLLALLCLLYLAILIRPCKRKEIDPQLLCDYAHRGLHGNGIPENSLAAFELACQKGYGIELDVQLSRDGEVMVFHDYSLERMTGRKEKLCELDAKELTCLSLAGTEQTIPTLTRVLELVAGRVPILVELKGESTDSSLCPKVAELLRAYKGPYCMESFNPMLVMTVRKQMPDILCGLLYTNVCRDKKKCSALNLLLTAMAFNFLARPQFIAFNKIDRNSLAVRLSTKLYHAPKFVWTVNTKEELETAHSLGEHPIFEKIHE